jgi:glutamine synthetase
LAIAATLAAGLKGIEEELVLQPPVEGNRLTLTPEEYATLDAVALPGDLSRAVDAFEQSELMHDVLGDYLHRALADAKRREWEDYQRHVSSWELKRYLAKL